jgi:hypothetical protein
MWCSRAVAGARSSSTDWLSGEDKYEISTRSVNGIRVLFSMPLHWTPPARNRAGDAGER